MIIWIICSRSISRKKYAVYSHFNSISFSFIRIMLRMWVCVWESLVLWSMCLLYLLLLLFFFLPCIYISPICANIDEILTRMEEFENSISIVCELAYYLYIRLLHNLNLFFVSTVAIVIVVMACFIRFNTLTQSSVISIYIFTCHQITNPIRNIEEKNPNHDYFR